MTRFKAFAIHFLISGCLLASFYFLVSRVWYPGNLFSADAGAPLIHILIGVDLILGPLVTLIIFKPHKKKLKQDMIIIVLCQLAFFLYGVTTIYMARPVYIAFVDDKFYMVRANEVASSDIAKAKFKEFSRESLLGPVFVGTAEPVDQKLKNDLVFSSLAGLGLQNLPEYYVPVATVRDKINRAALTSKTAKGGETQQRLAEYEHNHPSLTLGFLPLVHKGGSMFVVVNSKSGDVIEII